jgi:pyruvate dehydrogenase E2 component (dihydrolipoamide acetyltransferase)
MPVEIRLPNLGESIAHARLGQWLRKEGDRIRRGDVIAEVETDKTSVEIESPDDGVLSVIHVPAGTDNVVIDQLLAVLEVQEVGRTDVPGTAAVSAHTASSSPSTAPAQPLAVSDRVERASARPGDGAGPVERGQVQSVPSEPGETPTDDRSVAATALARRMAFAAGLRLQDVHGSGAGGTVTKADVDRVLSPVAPVAGHSAGPSVDALPGVAEAFEVVSLSPMRRVAAERLTRAKQQIPHFYLRVECDLEAVAALRDDLHARTGARLSFTAFSLRAVALALKQVPAANTTWVDGALRRHRTVDLAVAVNTPNGLVAPVIRRADEKSVAVLHEELRALADRARTGKLDPDEYSGGTCTLSNLGMFGISSLYPIINAPQTCIVGVGAVEQRPLVRAGALAVGRMMTATLSADHRALDGATGADFLSAFRALVEDPWSLLM